MKVTSRWNGSVAILDLEGALTAYGQNEPLYRKVKRLTRGSRADVVLNLGGVERMDAAGVGELVLLRLKLEETRRRLQLTGLNDRLEQLLKMVGLHDVFEPVASELAAVASLESRGRARSRNESGDWSAWGSRARLLAPKPL